MLPNHHFLIMTTRSVCDGGEKTIIIYFLGKNQLISSIVLSHRSLRTCSTAQYTQHTINVITICAIIKQHTDHILSMDVRLIMTKCTIILSIYYYIVSYTA